jgi:ElaB/YqjD/DUF883 family membrane-anchored ribosome-binding protein
VAERDYGNFREPRNGRGESVRAFADKATAKAKDAAAYFRNHDTKEVVADVKKYVVAHPGPALCGAVVVGFVAGRMLRRD